MLDLPMSQAEVEDWIKKGVEYGGGRIFYINISRFLKLAATAKEAHILNKLLALKCATPGTSNMTSRAFGRWRHET